LIDPGDSPHIEHPAPAKLCADGDVIGVSRRGAGCQLTGCNRWIGVAKTSAV